MARTVSIGVQDFAKLITGNSFYVDKTMFIKEWWENNDDVTLITRPRRFGKTLTISMLEQFFSNQYEGNGALFKDLAIWQEEKYRNLQGTYPVIALSFATVKEASFSSTRKKICQIIKNLFNKYDFLLDSNILNEDEKKDYRKISAEMEDYVASDSIGMLSNFLSRYYGKKVLIFLDEYDTPMQEAYVDGYWQEMALFIRSLFNSTFKTNPYLDKAVITGITRISKESVFSDLNNLEVVTTTSEKYAVSFGFTEEEVFAAMEEYGMAERMPEVKRWYDGFVFGTYRYIYNPWSIINFLDKRKLSAYWVNTSSNQLVSKLIREGSDDIKMIVEDLLQGKAFHAMIDEQIVFNQLDYRESAIWSLLLASGYLKVENYKFNDERRVEEYTLSLTNYEVSIMFRQMIADWFREPSPSYNKFIKALLLNDLDAMNEYMNRVSAATFSSFDTGGSGIQKAEEPERFYHGFVLGLMVDLADRYVITSNRESGFGRYDIILEPKDKSLNAIIIEFKVFNKRRFKTLEDTVQTALQQIEDKNYAQVLYDHGMPEDKIYKYGFAFEGKKVLIGSNRG